MLGAWDLFIGVNAVDYSGYPDCRPEFIAAFERLARLATKGGVEGGEFHVHAPLIMLSKAEIIREGMRLGVDYALTVSCYSADAEGRACGICDACRMRAAGFREARTTSYNVCYTKLLRGGQRRTGGGPRSGARGGQRGRERQPVSERGRIV